MCKEGCYICLLHDSEWNELMNFEELVSASKESVYSLSDYTDRRKSTNITQFDFCPFCAGKIDWKQLRKVSKVV